MDAATSRYGKEGSVLTKIKNTISSVGRDENNSPIYEAYKRGRIMRVFLKA